jgi:hypothetical protein
MAKRKTAHHAEASLRLLRRRIPSRAGLPVL